VDQKSNAYRQSAQSYREGEQRLAALPEVESLQGRSVAVIGCTGLIGGAILAALLEANATSLQHCPIRVYGVARSASVNLPQHAPGFQFVQASVTAVDLHAVLPACDYIVYVAGTASDYLSRRNETIETQVVGLERFLLRAAGCKGFVYISSARVYGRDGGDTPITEEQRALITPMHTDNLYDSCKHLGESLCLWHTLNRQIPATVVRLTNVYGPPNALRSETALIDFVRQAVTKGEITLKGHPDSVRNQCCVLDIACGVLKTLVRGRAGQAYNIGSLEHLTTRQMAEMIGSTFPMPIPVTWPQTGVTPSIQKISIAKAMQELDYVPVHTFAQLAPVIVGSSE
jgi:UDP-glucuronate decarboxylase